MNLLKSLLFKISFRYNSLRSTSSSINFYSSKSLPNVSSANKLFYINIKDVLLIKIDNSLIFRSIKSNISKTLHGLKITVPQYLIS